MNAPNDRPPERGDERIARIEAILPTLATKADVADLRAEMRVIAKAAESYATKADLADLRTEMHEGFGALRVEMHKGFGDLRADMRDVALTTTRWMVGVAIALGAGVLGLYFKTAAAPATTTAAAPSWESAPLVVEPPAPAASR